MYERKKCDNCNRMLEHGDHVTVIISNVEIEGRKSFRLKLSPDALSTRATKVYCENCLNTEDHILGDTDK